MVSHVRSEHIVVATSCTTTAESIVATSRGSSTATAASRATTATAASRSRSSSSTVAVPEDLSVRIAGSVVDDLLEPTGERVANFLVAQAIASAPADLDPASKLQHCLAVRVLLVHDALDQLVERILRIQVGDLYAGESQRLVSL